MADDVTTTMAERHRAAAREFLPQVELVIGGEERGSGDGGVHEHINAATGEIQAEVPLAGPREIDEAVRAARAALPAWAALHPVERKRILARFAELVRDHPWTEVSVLENGQPWDQAANMAAFAADWVEYYAGWADRIEGTITANNDTDGFVYTIPEPHGVVAMIITWNSPLLSLGMKLAPALAAGNTIVLKPAEFTSFTAMIWMRLAREAGIPDGVMNLVPGGPDAGETLVAHPGVDKISFTGGPTTAKSIMRGAAETLTPVLFELGGKGANLVFEDADLEALIPFSCGFALANTGQGCALPTRMLVQRSIYDDVLARVEAIVPHLTVGDPLQSGHVGGPLVSETALKRVLGVIDQAKADGARLLMGGERMDGEFEDGWFVQNTVFVDVDPASSLAQNEVFGPVLSIMPFDTEEEAVSIANDTLFGLTNYIQSTDRSRVRRLIPQMRSGTVGVNGGQCVHQSAPFGGVGISGFGREGGYAGLEEFVRVKTVLER